MAGLLSLGSAVALIPMPESLRWLLKGNRLHDAVAACERFERSPVVWRRKIESRGAQVSQQPAAVSGFTTPYSSTSGPTARFAFIGALFFLQPWGMTGFSLLTGPILLARGYNLKDTLLFVGLATFGPSVSTVLAGLLVDRVQRSTAIVLSSILLLMAAIVFFTLPAQGWMAAAVVVFGIGSGFFVPLMGTYGSEVFIAGAQGSAITAAWAINRVGAVLVPVALLPLLHRSGAGAVASCIYLALGLILLLVGVLGPRRPITLAVR
jgi:putative MFS transporter